jgi:tetratricopeptide (TPR) repeat protein
MVYQRCVAYKSCTDILSNTAQVLTSLVEALTEEDRSNTSSQQDDGLRLLEEAIELFQRCLTLQEFQYAEAQAREEETLAEPEPMDREIPDSDSAQPSSSAKLSGEIPDSEADSSSIQAEQEERWATIVEPVTNDTLLDTVLAQLETLTTLCGLVTADEGRGLAWIEEYSAGLMNDKMPAYVKGTDRKEEAALTKANFIAALADATFRSQRMDVPTYERALEEAYQSLNLANDPEGLCDYAEALVAFSHALRIGVGLKTIGASRWKALTAALESLTTASKLPTAENLPNIHLMRGDIELLRFQLGQSPTFYDTATKNAATLLKNANTYYRGAESHGVARNAQKEAEEAIIKGAIASCLGGNEEKLKELMKTEAKACQQVLEDAVDDGLITIEWLLKEGYLNR